MRHLQAERERSLSDKWLTLVSLAALSAITSAGGSAAEPALLGISFVSQLASGLAAEKEAWSSDGLRAIAGLFAALPLEGEAETSAFRLCMREAAAQSASSASFPVKHCMRVTSPLPCRLREGNQELRIMSSALSLASTQVHSSWERTLMGR